MYLPDIDYYAPESVAEVCQLLGQFGFKAQIISGGTDVIPKMKTGACMSEVLISLKNLADLKKIEHVPGKGVVIGARVTHNELVNSEVLNQKYLSVSEAAHQLDRKSVV